MMRRNGLSVLPTLLLVLACQPADNEQSAIDSSEADTAKVVMPEEGKMMAGGWSEGEIEQTTEDAVAFVLSRMNTSGKLKRIVQVKKQVVKGMNYDIIFELDDGSVWNAVVHQNLSGEFSIIESSKVR
ncbi:MAG: cystatin domain-containing protein [marine benthic group bacterium]|nr:cystatin domain-containing protein [Gemmatimonadota bacterium]